MLTPGAVAPPHHALTLRSKYRSSARCALPLLIRPDPSLVGSSDLCEAMTPSGTATFFA